MDIAFIYSEKDPASFLMQKKLKELGNFRFYKEENLLFTNICNKIDGNLIFLSKHESREKIKSICLHFTGNFDKAIYGGKDRQLSLANPLLLKNIFLEVLKEDIKEFNLTLEVTHHGPLCNKPHCFIEIGSTEKEWNNEEIASKIVNSIVRAIKKRVNWKVSIGFGGTHYCPKFNKIEAESDFALGHICPKYFIDKLDYNLFLQMINKSNIKPDYVLIDKKGTTSMQRKKIKDFVEKYNGENNVLKIIKV